ADRLPASRRLVSRLANGDVTASADGGIGLPRRLVQAGHDDGRGSLPRPLDAVSVEPRVHVLNQGVIEESGSISAGGGTPSRPEDGASLLVPSCALHCTSSTHSPCAPEHSMRSIIE